MKWLTVIPASETSKSASSGRSGAPRPATPLNATGHGKLVAYTDGAASGNGRRDCKGGVGVAWLHHSEYNVSERLTAPPRATNNRAELTAIIRALQIADIIDPSRVKPLVVKSDSLLCVKTCSIWLETWRKTGWKKRDGKTPLNTDLLRLLAALLSSSRKVSFVHVPAHTNGVDIDSVHNALADRLAVAGSRRERLDTIRTSN